jgi:hypothetical protein
LHARARELATSSTHGAELVFIEKDADPADAMQEDVECFPPMPSEWAKAEEQTKRLLDRIMLVGGTGPEANRTIAFTTRTNANGVGVSFVVAPRASWGRMIFVFHCKEPGADGGGNAAASSLVPEWRWGRQFFTQPMVYEQREDTGVRERNPFYVELKKRMDAALESSSDDVTLIRFVLVTVNPVEMEGNETFTVADAYKADGELKVGNTTDAASRSLRLLDDEALMDLMGMQQWCPTVAHASLAALKAREVLARFNNLGGDRNRPSPEQPPS